MKKYELVCIFDPQIGEGMFEQASERYSNYISEKGGEVVNTDVWGLRRMAYTSTALRNRTQGFYVVHQFQTDPSLIENMEQEMKLDTELLRHLIVVVDGDFLRVSELVPEGYLMEQLAPPRRDSRGGRPGGDRGDRGGRGRDNNRPDSRGHNDAEPNTEKTPNGEAVSEKTDSRGEDQE
jgi:small subunit ribosomal protein S6